MHAPAPTSQQGYRNPSERSVVWFWGLALPETCDRAYQTFASELRLHRNGGTGCLASLQRPPHFREALFDYPYHFFPIARGGWPIG